MSLVLPAVAAILAATAYAGFAQSVAVSKAQRRVSQLEAALEVEQTQRAAERAARIRAQKELKEARLGNAPGEQAFPFVPIGVLRTCYTTRNGTPRQPLLVPLARARLRLNTGPLGVPPACLEGLEQFSHCWVLYVFHANTDLQRLWQGDRRSMKAKARRVKVPRLNGEKVGVFATRSPHRPVPIGLSVAKVDRIDGDTLYLSGVDIVDGSPVLDIKPYLPYSDALSFAGVPSWVLAQGDDDPLHLREVVIEAKAMAELTSAWQRTVKLCCIPVFVRERRDIRCAATTGAVA
eukprot:jgi/Chlat1/2130/Chrsp17S08741